MRANVSQESLIRLPEVMRRTGMSKTDVYRKIKSGDFPKQIRRSHKVAVWVERQIDAWVMAQIPDDIRELLA